MFTNYSKTSIQNEVNVAKQKMRKRHKGSRVEFSDWHLNLTDFNSMTTVRLVLPYRIPAQAGSIELQYTILL